jgi:transcriptional regulator with XRE-family HTH domain
MGNRSDSPLRQAREAAGLNMAELARLAGTTRQQIERLETGQRKLSAEWARRLAPHVKASPQQLLFGGGGGPASVPVVGYVGAGATTHFYADQQEFDDVPAPEGSTSNTVAVEIRGDSLGSFFDRWLVFYDDVRRPVTADLVGKLCVVGLEDGRVLIKKVQRSQTEGLFHLISQFEAPILDVPIDWAARVKNMVPR